MSNAEQTAVPKPPVQKPRGRLGLTGWIFVGLVAGVLVGVLFKLWIPNGFVRDTVFVDGVFYVAGQGFIRLMKMLVAPLVFFSLVCGAAAMEDVAALGKTGGKILGFYLGTTACAICVALSIGFLVRPGVGLDLSQIASSEVAAPQEKVSAAETLLNIIPENPFGAIAGGAMLQVIFFALLVGVLIAKMGPRADAVARVARQCNDLMMEMTALVMKFAPIGVFCILARTFANLGFDAFAPLLKYMAGVVLSLGAQCFIVYSLLLFLFSRLNPIRFFRKFMPVMAFAFSTATSNAT
ncbi:MAG: dicarboxylate/amino acid:cation symporter, partial [Thermoguttaceae bacterium]|nr:dicarboxylate/amino acid:cation symporter [Thermoguttaceae bacterium]